MTSQQRLCGSVQALVHASGTLADALLAKQSASSCRAVHAPKGGALARLAPALQMQPAGTTVLFSSLAALLGSPGQANYAAANGSLDGAAHRHGGNLVAHVICNEGSPATFVLERSVKLIA